MAAMEKSLALLPYELPAIDAWCVFLLDNLEEFSTLAWYLVDDGTLVEETFARTMAQLDKTPFDPSFPTLAYNQVRKIVITQAIAVVESTCREEEANRNLQSNPLGGLPDLPRLAFMLRMVIRSSPTEVAEFLRVTPFEVQQLVSFAIDYLCGNLSSSLLTDSHEA
jgi:DNA-directed RNA polymerase specialized sigma24 family protein